MNIAFETVQSPVLRQTRTRRAVLAKALGLGGAAAAAIVLGRADAGAEHTSQPYTVTANVNLRSGPGTSYAVITVIPKGGIFTLNAREQNGFYEVNYGGRIGWVASQFIVPASGGTPDPVIVGTAYTTAAVNLRSGPSTSNSVLRVVARGAAVQISSTVQNGFRYVIHQGLAGWIAAQYLSTAAPGGDDVYDPRYATTTAALNLRAEPSTSARVLLVMPSGARVQLLDGYSNGFRKVSYNGTVGWAATAYLN